MRIDIVAVGRLKAGPEAALVRDYLDRFAKAGRGLGLPPARVTEVEDRRGLGMAAEADLLARSQGPRIGHDTPAHVLIGFPGSRILRIDIQRQALARLALRHIQQAAPDAAKPPVIMHEQMVDIACRRIERQETYNTRRTLLRHQHAGIRKGVLQHRQVGLPFASPWKRAQAITKDTQARDPVAPPERPYAPSGSRMCIHGWQSMRRRPDRPAARRGRFQSAMHGLSLRPPAPLSDCMRPIETKLSK